MLFGGFINRYCFPKKMIKKQERTLNTSIGREHIILLVIMLINIQCSSPNTPDATSESDIDLAMVGKWKFEKAIYTFEMNGSEVKDESDVFFVDTLELNEDMTYRMALNDSQTGKMDSDIGEWELSENGKALLLKNRSTTLVDKEKLKDIALPFIFLNRDKLQIYFDVNTPGHNNPRIPVIFKRLK